jgi:hypothetical protein
MSPGYSTFKIDLPLNKRLAIYTKLALTKIILALIRVLKHANSDVLKVLIV